MRGDLRSWRFPRLTCWWHFVSSTKEAKFNPANLDLGTSMLKETATIERDQELEYLTARLVKLNCLSSIPISRVVFEHIRLGRTVRIGDLNENRALLCLFVP